MFYDGDVDRVREIQREAFDAGARAMLEANKRAVAAYSEEYPQARACREFYSLAAEVTEDARLDHLEGRP